MYAALRAWGYDLIFKPVLRYSSQNVKGNVDAELVLQAMIDLEKYEQAVIITGDGDFYCLVKHLAEQKKLKRLVIPNRYKHSILLRRALPPEGDYITFMNDLRTRLEFKKEHPRR